MYNRNVILSAVAAISIGLSANALVAQSSTATTTQTQSAKPAGKQIKFTIQNKSAAPVDLQSGDQQIHLAAGQSQQVKAPAGTKIVTTSDSSTSQAGTVAVEVTDTMSGSTVNLR